MRLLIEAFEDAFAVFGPYADVPASVSPMMERRWKPSKPLPVSIIFVASGPLVTVLSSPFLNVSSSATESQYPIIEHIVLIFLVNFFAR